MFSENNSSLDISNIKYIKIFTALIFSWFFIDHANNARLDSSWNFIDSVDLIFHEAGHSLFMFFGDFIRISAGSFFQIALPLFFVIYFLFKKEKFSASLLLFWLGQNIMNVAIYAGDAIVQRLDLLGGDGVMHDWNFILSYLHILKYTDNIAYVMYNFGFFVIIIAMVLSFYFAFAKEENL